MATKEMLAAIDEELARLQLVRKLLAGEPEPARRGATAKTAKKKPATKSTRGKRTLSPEARERIAAAQRKRWAASKRAAKKAAK